MMQHIVIPVSVFIIYEAEFMVSPYHTPGPYLFPFKILKTGS